LSCIWSNHFESLEEEKFYIYQFGRALCEELISGSSTICDTDRIMWWLIFFLFLAMQGIKSIALHMLSKHSTTELRPQPGMFKFYASI
jgi:hypothetical protein